MSMSTGFIIWGGLMFAATEVPKPWLLRALGRPFLTHLTIGAGAYMTHAGSFEGLAAAATAEVLSAFSIKVMRKTHGYIPPGERYVPGSVRDYTEALGEWDDEHKCYVSEFNEEVPA